MVSYIRNLVVTAFYIWGIGCNGMEQATTEQRMTVNAWINSINDRMVFNHADTIIATLEKENTQNSILLALKNHIENHKQTTVSALSQLFFTLLLRFSKDFADGLINSVCKNITYMCGQNLANSFEAFKTTMYESNNYAPKDYSFGNKIDILHALIGWLESIKNAIDQDRKSNNVWNEKNAHDEAERIKKLLKECREIMKKANVLEAQQECF